MRAFRFGLSARTTGSRREWQDQARRAEAAGFDVIQVPDHLDESLPPLAALCSAADVTDELRVGTLVVNNDLRHPVLLAREAATGSTTRPACRSTPRRRASPASPSPWRSCAGSWTVTT